MDNGNPKATAFNADLSKWDVSTVQRSGGMFFGASSFNSDLSKWQSTEEREKERVRCFWCCLAKNHRKTDIASPLSSLLVPLLPLLLLQL